MKSNSKDYYLVFDTNVLYQSYDKKADFTSFSFNATFQNTVEMINQLDIYERVAIAIPDVVWSEMTKQIIDAHKGKLLDFEAYVKKWKFPEYSFSRRYNDDFSVYIQGEIEKYRNEITKSINKVVDLPLPSDNRFKGIIRRAFDKEPPFGGKEKNSDKGFKDVLIWESILEFASNFTVADFIFYTKDNGFNEKLTTEFKKLNPETNIYICSSESKIKERLELWAQEIDIFSYQPITEYEEHYGLIEWLKSEDCSIQLIDNDFDIVEKSRIITSSSVKIVAYENIQLTCSDDSSKQYLLDATLEVVYNFKEAVSIKETIDVYLSVRCVDAVYLIEDVYKADEKDINGIEE